MKQKNPLRDFFVSKIPSQTWLRIRYFLIRFLIGSHAAHNFC